MDGAPHFGGWIKVYRSMLDHGHFTMPDKTFKLWIFLLLRVNHTQKAGCAAGEGWITYQMIQDACCEEGGPVWSKHTISAALGYLEKNGYIQRIKIKSGAPQRIRIINWDKYQGESGAVTAPTTAPPTAPVTAPRSALKQERIRMPRRESQSPPAEEYSDDFQTFWGLYPRRVQKKAAYTKWKAQIRKGTPAADLVTAAKHYAVTRHGEDPRYTMMPETFLGPHDRWTEYLQPPAPKLTVLGRNRGATALEQLREEARAREGLN